MSKNAMETDIDDHLQTIIEYTERDDADAIKMLSWIKNEAEAARDRLNEGYNVHTTGMTLRDYFAGQALAGLCATVTGQWELRIVKQLTEDAYVIADAMLTARAVAALEGKS